ncbi:MAG: YdcF family protein [Alkalispirochaeta sp.]
MITKFIEPWILFPGNLIVLLAALAVVLVRTRRHMLRWGQPPAATGAVTAGATLLSAVAVLLYLASTGIVADRVMGALERAVPPVSAAELSRADAVVVLGGGVIVESPAEQLIQELDHAVSSEESRADTTEGTPVDVDRPAAGRSRPAANASGAALSPEAESRLLYGVRLARRLQVPLVVTGGRVLAAEVVPPEAEVAAVLAEELGVPRSMIRVEAESRTTAENARFTAERFDLERVVVVTSAYHMRRAVLAFSREGLSALPAPAAYRRDRRPLRPVMFMPTATNLRDTATVAREQIGLWWYRLVL